MNDKLNLHRHEVALGVIEELIKDYESEEYDDEVSALSLTKRILNIRIRQLERKIPKSRR